MEFRVYGAAVNTSGGSTNKLGGVGVPTGSGYCERDTNCGYEFLHGLGFGALGE